jgi:hypothetical protein
LLGGVSIGGAGSGTTSAGLLFADEDGTGGSESIAR